MIWWREKLYNLADAKIWLIPSKNLKIFRKNLNRAIISRIACCQLSLSTKLTSELFNMNSLIGQAEIKMKDNIKLSFIKLFF